MMEARSDKHPTRYVVAMIKGGLGNQMFTYAAARSYALGRKRELWLDDSSGYERDRYQRTYLLDRFPVAAAPAPDEVRLGGSRSGRHRRTRWLNRLLPENQQNYLSEKRGRRSSQLNAFQSRREVVYLNGYWQNESYFHQHADLIRSELEPPPLSGEADLEIERELRTTDSVFLHIRRERYFPRLTEKYYNSCISEAIQLFPEARFEVFGDGLDWAKEQLKFRGRPARFHDPGGSGELRDMRLMANCRHSIVANSSFSWWGAWLIPRGDKRVWSPGNPGWPVQAAEGWTLIANRLEREPRELQA